MQLLKFSFFLLLKTSYICIYLPTYLPKYADYAIVSGISVCAAFLIYAYFATYVFTLPLYFCTLTYLPTYYLPTYLRIYLRIYLPTSTRIYLRIYLPTSTFYRTYIYLALVAYIYLAPTSLSIYLPTCSSIFTALRYRLIAVDTTSVA